MLKIHCIPCYYNHKNSSFICFFFPTQLATEARSQLVLTCGADNRCVSHNVVFLIDLTSLNLARSLWDSRSLTSCRMNISQRSPRDGRSPIKSLTDKSLIESEHLTVFGHTILRDFLNRKKGKLWKSMETSELTMETSQKSWKLLKIKEKPGNCRKYGTLGNVLLK